MYLKRNAHIISTNERSVKSQSSIQGELSVHMTSGRDNHGLADRRGVKKETKKEIF